MLPPPRLRQQNTLKTCSIPVRIVLMSDKEEKQASVVVLRRLGNAGSLGDAAALAACLSPMRRTGAKTVPAGACICVSLLSAAATLCDDAPPQELTVCHHALGTRSQG